MKQKSNNWIFLMAMLFTITFSASAQIYVKSRPPFQVVVKPPQPNPEYIWIDEEWEWDGKNYRYSGGRWDNPPKIGYYRRPGYWRTSSKGVSWVKGNWYPQKKGNNGKHKGHYKKGNNGNDKGKYKKKYKIKG